MSLAVIPVYDFQWEVGGNVPTLFPNVWVNVNSDFETDFRGHAIFDTGFATTYRIATVNGSNAIDMAGSAPVQTNGKRLLYFETRLQTPPLNPLLSGQTDQAGIMMFNDGAQTVPAGAQRGLWFIIQRDDSSTYSWSLFMVDDNDMATTLTGAFLPSLNDGDYIRIRVEIDMHTSTAPAIRCYLDDAIVVNYLGVSTTAMGYTVAQFNAAPCYWGCVARQTRGSNEDGLYPRAWRFDWNTAGHLGEFNFLEADQFPEPALSPATTLTPITLATENSGDSSSYTLPQNPSWAIPIADQFKVNEFETDMEMYVVTHPGQSVPRRRWELQWGPMGLTERNTFRSFINDVASTRESFDWTDPQTGETITGRAIENFRIAEIGPDIFTVRCVVEELIVVT